MRICVCHERVRDKKGGRGQSSLKAIVNSSLAQPKTFFFAVFLSNLYAQITSYRAWTDERKTGWHARTRVPTHSGTHNLLFRKTSDEGLTLPSLDYRTSTENVNVTNEIKAHQHTEVISQHLVFLKPKKNTPPLLWRMHRGFPQDTP